MNTDIIYRDSILVKSPSGNYDGWCPHTVRDREVIHILLHPIGFLPHRHGETGQRLCEALGSLLPPARRLLGRLFCLLGLSRRRRAGPGWHGHGRVGRDGSQGSLGDQIWIVRHLGRLFPQLLLFWSIRSHLDLSSGHEALPSGLPCIYVPSHDGLPLGLAACGGPQGSCLAHFGLVLFRGRGTWFRFPDLELDVLRPALRSSHGDGSHVRRSHLPAAIKEAAG
mmetsp:Transcript_97341/g.135255  ORF Transcript_97341/g.135255 Transcript_97341/m.135255 type:complete len:224 (+) Transcript_97341:833-1504(+)